MVKVTFVEHDGSQTQVDAAAGQSLMKAATYGEVPGISADCGGNAACGTCRIYVPQEWPYPRVLRARASCLCRCAVGPRGRQGGH